MLIDLAHDEIFVDNFAGGGGASEGAEQALERPVHTAVNHWDVALACHAANHPSSIHRCEDVYAIDPREAIGDLRVGGGWFSPDCTNHSRAKGGKPRDQKIRGLAWVAVKWARTVRPRVLFLENVVEFLDWGPLDSKTGKPIEARKGEIFRRWVRELEKLGYVVQWRALVAADYSAPTSRKRLYLIARCDGLPIVWPEPTHGPGRAHPHRTAAEIIDWSIPCPSIFERKKPLAEPTLRRIAAGIRRFVLESGDPFIVPVTHPRDARVHSIRQPLRTVTAANRGELALVCPTLIHRSNGERKGQAPRIYDIRRPIGTIVAKGLKHALVTAFITKHYGSPENRMRAIGQDARAPLSTVTARDHHAVTAAFLTKFYGTAGAGADVREPVPTITAGGGRGGGHIGEVRALLERFAPGTPLRPVRAQCDLFDGTPSNDAPLGTVVINGERYAIVDIGMRMLQPRELFRAQGFPESYVIDPVAEVKTKRGTVVRRKLNKGEQIALAGNSVCPPVARELIRANFARRQAVAA
jgi:DNA (cytosine-5)-methyltransferase 1